MLKNISLLYFFFNFFKFYILEADFEFVYFFKYIYLLELIVYSYFFFDYFVVFDCFFYVCSLLIIYLINFYSE